MHPRRNNHLSISSPSTSALSPTALLTPRTPRSGLSPQQLLGRSPPPSPGLPPPSRHGKRSSYGHSRLVKKLLAVFCSLVVLAWLGIRRWYTTSLGISYEMEYEMVGDSLLPEEPSVVVVTDLRGKPKWTISIPTELEFPLHPMQYRELCGQASEVSHTVSENTNLLAKRNQRGYYYVDPHFIDVHDAIEQGLLPKSQEKTSMVSAVGWDDNAMKGANMYNGQKMEICERSLTFVMETSDAGMGKTLMSLWMAYGLAQKEGRAFFVDDTRWPYGNYTSYFAPPPAPQCLPPLTNEVMPCPHNARHLLVSAATIPWTFGHAFNEEYEDPKKSEVQRQHRIFAMLREGYEALFRLRDDDAEYVQDRVSALYEPVVKKGGINVGLHVRRGDRHPFEYQYSKDYIPLDRYMQTARDALVAHYGHPLALNVSSAWGAKAARASVPPSETPSVSPKAPSDFIAEMASQAVLASDDPDVYSAPEVSNAARAQDRIVLASKTTLEASGARNRNRYIDEISGWEGGFFRDVFWSLGRSTKAAVGEAKGKELSEQAVRMRELIGRAYLLDLAVLAKADVVLCTTSATACRLLAVMMGWEKGIQQAGWKNIDGSFHWRGIDW